MSVSPIVLDFCPICSLNCQCSACGRKAGNVARALKKACEEQSKSASEAVFDDILDRCLTASSKCGVIRKKIKISTDEEQSTLPASTTKSTEKVGRPPRLSTDSAQEKEKRNKKRETRRDDKEEMTKKRGTRKEEKKERKKKREERRDEKEERNKKGGKRRIIDTARLLTKGRA